MQFFISGNVPSSKNSQTWTGRFLVKSKTSQRYIKETQLQWIKHAKQFREQFDKLPKPVPVGLHFVRGSRHRWDFHNAVQILADLMTQNNWIADDCFSEVFFIPLPVNNNFYQYDKENPGVYIQILDCDYITTLNGLT